MCIVMSQFMLWSTLLVREVVQEIAGVRDVPLCQVTQLVAPL